MFQSIANFQQIKIRQNSTKYNNIQQHSTNFDEFRRNPTKSDEIRRNSTKFYEIRQNAGGGSGTPAPGQSHWYHNWNLCLFVNFWICGISGIFGTCGLYWSSSFVFVFLVSGDCWFMFDVFGLFVYVLGFFWGGFVGCFCFWCFWNWWLFLCLEGLESLDFGECLEVLEFGDVFENGEFVDSFYYLFIFDVLDVWEFSFLWTLGLLWNLVDFSNFGCVGCLWVWFFGIWWLFGIWDLGNICMFEFVFMILVDFELFEFWILGNFGNVAVILQRNCSTAIEL